MSLKRKKLTKIGFYLFVFFLGVCIVMEVYTRTPDNLDIRPLRLSPNIEEATLIFHGAKDERNPELTAITSRYRKLIQKRKNSVVVNYDWSSGSNNRLRASSNALKFGSELGKELAGYQNLKYLRVIAHSASGFIPDELCRAYKNLGGKAHIETTFLDAFGLRGFLDSNYGTRNHGSCADYSTNIVNTDDPAPTTNKFFKNSWNLDVTGLDRPEGFVFRKDPRTSKDDIWLGVSDTLDDVKRNLSNPNQQTNGHYWPPYYFLETLDEETVIPGRRNHKDFPRGLVVKAEELD